VRSLKTFSPVMVSIMTKFPYGFHNGLYSKMVPCKKFLGDDNFI